MAATRRVYIWLIHVRFILINKCIDTAHTRELRQRRVFAGHHVVSTSSCSVQQGQTLLTAPREAALRLWHGHGDSRDRRHKERQAKEEVPLRETHRE